MNNISLKKITAGVFVTALLSTFVSADEGLKNTLINVESTTAHNLDFAQFDGNKDGVISQVEAQKNKLLNDSFAKVDTNGDATISRDEFDVFVNNMQ